MDKLNIFKDDKHENNLTTAYLTLFNKIRLVRIVFFDRVAEEFEEKKIDESFGSFQREEINIEDVWTQRGEKNLGTIEDKSKILSILISDDKFEKDIDVKRVDRGAIYDGVIKFKSKIGASKEDWVFIIENKPSVNNAYEEQLNLNIENKNTYIIDKAVTLSWRDIIKDLLVLLEGSLLNYLEILFIEDFIALIWKNYSYINSCSNFSLCRDNKNLLKRRCESILDNISEKNKLDSVKKVGDYLGLDILSRTEDIARYILLSVGDDEIILSVYPGDTQGQAREFYKRLDDIDGLLALRDKGYTIFRNFHFSFRSTHMNYSSIEDDVEVYLDFWKNEKSIVEIKRENFSNYVERLLANNMLSDSDIEEFKANIIKSKRQSINVCPSIGISYSWALRKAKDLDEKDLFEDEVEDKTREIFKTILE